MSNAAQVQILNLRTGSHVSDSDSHLLARFLTERDEDAFGDTAPSYTEPANGFSEIEPTPTTPSRRSSSSSLDGRTR
ncbi:hypothetical protein [Fimbriiglobus ruber]|nr:hypothetical protein [Fimbriiglobus ruber]